MPVHIYDVLLESHCIYYLVHQLVRPLLHCNLVFRDFNLIHSNMHGCINISWVPWAQVFSSQIHIFTDTPQSILTVYVYMCACQYTHVYSHMCRCVYAHHDTCKCSCHMTKLNFSFSTFPSVWFFLHNVHVIMLYIHFVFIFLCHRQRELSSTGLPHRSHSGVRPKVGSSKSQPLESSHQSHHLLVSKVWIRRKLNSETELVLKLHYLIEYAGLSMKF